MNDSPPDWMDQGMLIESLVNEYEIRGTRRKAGLKDANFAMQVVSALLAAAFAVAGRQFGEGENARQSE